MNRRFARILSVTVALLLLIGVLAMAEGSNITASLVSQVSRLAFETDNATINASARFLWDGELFKTFTGEYRQSGTDSLMQVSLDTPKSDGTVYTGGFTVVGNGDKAYSIDTYDGPYYLEWSATPSSSILTDSALNRAAMSMLEAAVGASSVFDDHVVITENETGGTAYQYAFAQGDMPAIVNSVLNYVAVSRFASPTAQYIADTDTVDIVYEDWASTFAEYYREFTGDSMPDGYLDDVYATDDADALRQYDEIVSAMQKGTTEIAAEYSTGTLLFRADGTRQWYETDEAYQRDMGQIEIRYENAESAFRAYYKETTGEDLPENAVSVIYASGNDELWNAYCDMYSAMNDSYVALAMADDSAVAVRVRADGTAELLDHVDLANTETVTQRIASTFAAVAISDAEFTVETGADGALSSAKGTVSFAVTDTSGEEHALSIEFEIAISNRGTTEVGAFQGEDYGVTSAEAYYESIGSGEPVQSNMPETIRFNGVDYKTMISG